MKPGFVCFLNERLTRDATQKGGGIAFDLHASWRVQGGFVHQEISVTVCN